MNDMLMTKKQVAKLLHVRPPYVDQLMDRGELPYVINSWNNERCVLASKVSVYKEQMKRRQAEGLDEMVRTSVELGLYDAEYKDMLGNDEQPVASPGTSP